MYNGGLTKYKYGKHTFQKAEHTCSCAIDLHGTSFASKCKDKKYVDIMYENRFRVLAKAYRVGRQVKVQRKHIQRKQDALIMEADMVVQKVYARACVYKG